MKREIIVDNFAGGGGASLGIEAGVGRPVDFAINHDAEAIAMHRVNHPSTRHFCESVWDIDPRALAAGRQVGLGWFSPDCTFHSKARGGKPFRDRDRARRVRGLAWIVVRWAKAVRPRVIMLENVEEFADWGPLLPDGTPCPNSDYPVRRCIHDGLTLKRLPLTDPREPGGHDMRLAFKRTQARKWLAAERARQREVPRNVILFGGAAKL